MKIKQKKETLKLKISHIGPSGIVICTKETLENGFSRFWFQLQTGDLTKTPQGTYEALLFASKICNAFNEYDKLKENNATMLDASKNFQKHGTETN